MHNLIPTNHYIFQVLIKSCLLQYEADHDAKDDVMSQSSDITHIDTIHMHQVHTGRAVNALRLAVRGLCALGRLLQAVAKAVIQFLTKKSSADENSTRLLSFAQSADIAN